MDWNAFWAGYGVGSAQWGFIDVTVLVIIWPLRSFIGILKQPGVRARIKYTLGIELTPDETTALKESMKK